MENDDNLIELTTMKAAIKYDLMFAMKHLRGRHDQKLHGNRGVAAGMGVERSIEHPLGASERLKLTQGVFDDVKAKFTGGGRSWSPGRRKYTWDYINWATGGKIGAGPDAKTYGEDVARGANHLRRLIEGNAQIKALGTKRETGTEKPAAPPKAKPTPPKPASAPVALEGKPAGSSAMSEHYDFSRMTRGGEIRKGIDNALGAMESVHGDGTLSKIPILKGASAGGVAAFWHSGGTAVKITFAKNSNTGNSFAHESGHFIDHGILGYGKNFGISDSRVSGSPEFNAAKADLWDAISNSETGKRIVDGAKGKIPDKKFPVSPAMEKFYPEGKTARIDTRYLSRYFASPKEFVARSYAQYIAVRSKNPAMLAEVKSMQAKMEGDTYEAWMEKHNQAFVWGDKEFEPIAAAYDRIFASVGWRK